MLEKKFLTFVVISIATLFNLEANALQNLSLQEALTIMKQDNLELKISKFNEQIQAQESKIAKGYQYGKLDLELQALRSNDAGNIFGFKLKSREANFGDFGFSDFLAPLGGAISGAANGQQPTDMNGLLAVKPNDLNYPDARNHFQTTLTYMVPLYTGGQLNQYKKITQSLYRMSQLNTEKLLNEKIFQTKKTFYDISLLSQYIDNLSSIVQNIEQLQNIVFSMREEGFAKEIDELEVKTRKSEADSMLSQATYNKELAYQYLSFLLNQKVTSIQRIEGSATVPKFNTIGLVQNNLDIQKAKLGLKITDMAIQVEESKFLPKVGAFGEYGSSDNQLFNDFTQKDFYTVGLQLEWNLFNGEIDKNNLEKAKIENMKVQEQVELAQKGIELKIQKLLTEIKSKKAEIESLETQFEFANQVYDNYQERYQEGISSISDVLIQQSKELEVLLKLLSSKNDKNTKIFELTSLLNQGEV